ncbi:MAG: bifunctional phosphopantothenoylcysteine decarboxylase/phosphopantothenate--cysteine ligase CoaBC [Peptostreptococcaceae bacterium]|nr:bifunctional phosphopantothenoylcysteine decarboxylase/phosphopantothenate--cysteine ligase CoaBC [Peptostreptococcaceae bacterium]
MLNGKTVVLGVTGSIAAYKAAEIVSLLKKMNAEVKVIMTESSTKLIGECTLQTLSNNPVYTKLFSNTFSLEIDHISLAKSANVILIAPASANIIGKIASGIADDILSTTVMATDAIKFIAPAMNSKMYLNPIVQKNIEFLKNLGYKFIEPDSGILACGDDGIGKLATPQAIVEVIANALTSKPTLKGKRVLITAGPTIEALDPVRYLTNHSSGKMGYAMASEAISRGADVTLVSGPVHISPPKGCTVINVKSAIEMNDIVLKYCSSSDIIVKSAAVSDYRPKETSCQKIKKTNDDLVIELERNPDILKNLSQIKNPGQILIGFAAETENLIANATDKMERKKLDIIIANDISIKDSGFKSDMNKATLIFKSGEIKKFVLMSKRVLSKRIFDEIENLLTTN